jgi:hypothetical protein
MLLEGIRHSRSVNITDTYGKKVGLILPGIQVLVGCDALHYFKGEP